MKRTVCRQNYCAGCMACLEVCGKKAITIQDSWDGYNAVIDPAKCVECGKCFRVCQENNVPRAEKPVYWKQGWAESEEIRSSASSGGIATALAVSFIKDGGKVCSCVFENGKFGFAFAENESEAKKFTGSKYVKSNPEGIYKKIKSYIINGEKVLFIGLPCQVAAVKNYVGKNDNLYTVDLICHGTPSPKTLELFLKDYHSTLKDNKALSFRNKMSFYLSEQQKPFAEMGITDNYMLGFLSSLFYTENCYECKYAKLERQGDITLGDSWGSELPAEIQGGGISLVLCQSEKGKELLGKAELCLLDVDLDNAIQNNHQLKMPSMRHQNRNLFFEEIRKGKSFKRAIFRCFPQKYIKNFVKTVLIKTKLIKR